MTLFGSEIVGRPLDEVDTPALVIDADAMERNIARMAAFFAERPAKLRPHAKTHKSPIIAHKQLEAGAVGITCAKLGEAEALVEGGIKDILIANQIVGPVKIARLVRLARSRWTTWTTPGRSRRPRWQPGRPYGCWSR